MKLNKKLTLLILVFALLATTSYAKSFTDVLGNSFILINDFFKNENYKPYSLIIDFFVFSVVFMAIYMRGVKFAFKEVTKTEKALAVILGLTTAFLMVIGGYSISKLLPFLQYLLFFLLFALMWWLLKDMKSKWTRFFLALLFTLLLILIFLALFSGISTNISCPESALPWLPWLLALLLFILFLFLLKDIKNAFGRILLALLLTITIVLLILFLLNTFSKELGCPEGPFTTSLLGDVGDSFKRMDFGSFGGFGTGGAGGSLLPTLPQVKPPEKPQRSTVGDIFNVKPDLYSSPEEHKKGIEKVGKEGIIIDGKSYKYEDNKLTADGQFVPESEYPQVLSARVEQDKKQEQKKAVAKSKEGILPGGFSGWWLLLLPALAILLFRRRIGGVLSGFRRRGGRRRRTPFGEGGFIGDPKKYVIDRITKTIQELEEVTARIIESQDEKDKFVLLGENKERIRKALEEASLANLWTEKGRKAINDEHPILGELLVLEERLRHHLRRLITAEDVFLTNLGRWEQFIPQNYDQVLRNLASKNAKPSEFKQMGVIQLISVCDAFEKQDEASIEELLRLMREEKIGELVKGKYKVVGADWERLKKYNTHENIILALAIKKSKAQIYLLKTLQKALEEKDKEQNVAKVMGENLQAPESKSHLSDAKNESLKRMIETLRQEAREKGVDEGEYISAQLAMHPIKYVERKDDAKTEKTGSRELAGVR